MNNKNEKKLDNNKKNEVKNLDTKKNKSSKEQEEKKIKVKPIKKNKIKKNISSGIAFVNSTFNNTIISIADEQGNVVAWSSAGLKGFKDQENLHHMLLKSQQTMPAEKLMNKV